MAVEPANHGLAALREERTSASRPIASPMRRFLGRTSDDLHIVAVAKWGKRKEILSDIQCQDLFLSKSVEHQSSVSSMISVILIACLSLTCNIEQHRNECIRVSQENNLREIWFFLPLCAFQTPLKERERKREREERSKNEEETRLH